MPNYIYALLCPLGKIRYIGKTNKPERRLTQHISAARAQRNLNYSGRWIRSLLENGQKPTLKILYEVGDNEDWTEVERRTIAEYRKKGFCLTNTAEGGEGEFDQSPEAIAERVRKILLTKSTPEYKERTKDSWKAPWRDLDIRKSRIAGMLASKKRPGSFEKRQALGFEIARRPGVLEKRSSKMKANYPTSKLKEIQSSERMKTIHRQTLAKRWAEPGAREALAAELRNPERQAIMQSAITPEIKAARLAKATETLRKPENRKSASEKAKAQWQDPEYLTKKKAELANRHAPKHTPEHTTLMRDRRNGKRRQERAGESPESREERLAKRRAKRLADKLAKSV